MDFTGATLSRSVSSYHNGSLGSDVNVYKRASVIVVSYLVGVLAYACAIPGCGNSDLNGEGHIVDIVALVIGEIYGDLAGRRIVACGGLCAVPLMIVEGSIGVVSDPDLVAR